MNKQSYLAALKRSLSGLAADQVADIVGDYEQHFIDAMARGRSEEECARALGDPRKIALEFKAVVHLDAFREKRSVPNFFRMAFTLVCMASVNIFLLPFVLVPPLVLLSVYLASAGFFAGGVVITASSASGIDKIPFKYDGRPMALVVVNEADKIRPEQSDFGFHTGLYGVHVVAEPVTGEREPAAVNAPSGTGTKLVSGLFYVAAGIALFVFGQKLARYLGMGMRRYLTANANILRNARKTSGEGALSEPVPE